MKQLYKHQENIIQKNPAKTLLCWSCGVGKSLAAIELAKKNGKMPIYVCPKALKEKWNRDLVANNTTGIVVTKEEFRRDWNKLPYCDVIVWDEAHAVSGMKSQMTKSLLAYLKKHKTQYIYLLTATPYMANPFSIFVLARILGHNWNYIDFKQKFFQDRYLGRRIVPEIRPGMEQEVAKLVARIGDVVKLDDCVDIPDQVFETEMFSLTKEQEAAKKAVIEINPVVRFTKYHQIENGTLKSDGYTDDLFIQNNKIERIKSICDENDKVAVICRYNLQVEQIAKELEKEGKKVFQITGSVKDRDAVVQEVDKTDKCVVIINASCSEGYELPSVNTIIFASLSFSLKDHEQIVGRFLRIHAMSKNLYIYLVVSGGVDEGVYNAIMSKKDFQIAIYAKTL